jgi:hypothetical protein
MTTLNEIHDMWEKDSQIDELKLDIESLKSSKLHGKYMVILSRKKLSLKKLELEFDELIRDKFLWYSGKMTKEQMDSLGWDYDPLNGLKVLKGDMDKFYEADKDIQESKSKIAYVKESISVLEEIIS